MLAVMSNPSAPDALNHDYKVKLERAKKASIAKAKQIARNRHVYISQNSRTNPPALAINSWRANNPIIPVEPERTIKAESPGDLFVNPRKSRSTPDGCLTGDTVSVRAVDDFLRPASSKKRKLQASDVGDPVKFEGEKPSAAVSDSSRVTGYKYTRPYAPPKKVAKSKDSGTKYNFIESVVTRTTQHSSDWYKTINLKQKFSRGDLENLKYMTTLIQACITHAKNSQDTEEAVAKVRQRIHQAEFYDFLSGVLIKKSKLLEDGGLALVFDDSSDIFPWDVRLDALGLHQKWLAGNIDPHLLVGIETKNKKNSSGKEVKTRNLEPGYAGRTSCNYTGHGQLQNGQWWPLQICAMRDGCHGDIEAGIHGQTGKGAFSIVVSSGGYADVDEGETIRYCGTSGSEGKATAGTEKMLESFRLKNLIRVLRSAALSAKNPYRPSKGLRYDGLYKITAFTILDEDTAMYQFTLVRETGQYPIRYKGVEKRPTVEELAEYTKIRKLLGIGG